MPVSAAVKSGSADQQACCLRILRQGSRRRRRIGNLAKDAGLHVIDNERQRPRVERILERFGHIEAVEEIRRRDVTSMSSQKSDGEAGR